MNPRSPVGPTGDLPPRGARVAVIGDVGGHLAELRRELVRLGADEETGELPDDLTIVQVGDLVHRGPDSAGVVSSSTVICADDPDSGSSWSATTRRST